jgi:hypothetical protein
MSVLKRDGKSMTAPFFSHLISTILASMIFFIHCSSQAKNLINLIYEKISGTAKVRKMAATNRTEHLVDKLHPGVLSSECTLSNPHDYGSEELRQRDRKHQRNKPSECRYAEEART